MGGQLTIGDGADLERLLKARKEVAELLTWAGRRLLGKRVGRLVGQVYCDACGDKPAIAEIREHRRHGLVYFASSPAWVELDTSTRAEALDEKLQTGRRAHFDEAICLVLLRFPDAYRYPGIGGLVAEERQESPVARCPRHGDVALDLAQLRGLDARLGIRSKLFVHCGSS